ncbi:MAG: ankyrin repeat domain-containing protein [Pyrinomonadaceae bacterium]|nr:ankyrin repeat domain-containing protein [Pyrinomonadaceae bacterium]
MSDRHLPVRPDLDQLKHQAKDLLRSIRRGDPSALEEFNRYHPTPVAADNVRLADAQLALARSYEAPSWPRLVQACKIIDAIWRDDLDAVRQLVMKNPNLLHENAGIRNSNWGPPMSYAANLGRDAIIKMLHELGATDLESAIDRATLQSKIGTARMLHQMMGSPRPPEGALGGPAYTLSSSGTALMLEFGAQVLDANGKRLAPVDVVLETDSRRPSAKHNILESYVQHGLVLPDTPTMALHRGRLDLLGEHLRRDPDLLRRTFTHEEIYPPELGCHDEILATHGTPLAGTTLLHMCVDYDEMEIARWLIERGMNVNTRAAMDKDGFGGHTALFATVVSQPNFWMNHNQQPQVAPFTQLLLDRGADPSARASLRKQLHPGYGPTYDVETMHEYRDVTPLSWGKRFHARVFVSEPALRLIAERGGHD